ncbi:Adenylate kinase/UMP-CMP kinase [Carpediemonas membranifera]|uniref:Adenylate kinase/UMP-CMP kinase n=1 Tax=Carpediemonas membranifera TaxID=201153 RepID=A0A8J6E728_9EUKA|nr:Adenylate kinase/UMP-CMP kinase [Carpediemonas membranifera]|eukprot:KAG9390220.1 Adenylate kinase/UMP-CMP kinase [Carpediemonas membranifera]
MTNTTFDASKFADSNVIFVLGGPGSGKGTQSAFLVKRFPEICHLSAGDLLREEVADKNSELGEEISYMIKNGLIVRAEVTVKLLQNAMAKNPEKKLFLIDGFPRAIEQAECFEKMVGTCKFVLFLDVPEDVMRDRLLERGKTSGRTDDNVESIIKRFRTYRETTMPVIELYRERVVTVRGDRTPEEVSAELEDIFSQL